MTTDSEDDRIRGLEDQVRRLTLMLESAPDFITRITGSCTFLVIQKTSSASSIRACLFCKSSFYPSTCWQG